MCVCLFAEKCPPIPCIRPYSWFAFLCKELSPLITASVQVVMRLRRCPLKSSLPNPTQLAEKLPRLSTNPLSVSINLNLLRSWLDLPMDGATHEWVKLRLPSIHEHLVFWKARGIPIGTLFK